MLQSKRKAMRYVSVAVAVVFMAVSILSSTESVSAASGLKVTANKKTIHAGKAASLKANRDVKWSISDRKTAKLTEAGKREVTVIGLKAGTVHVTAKAGKKAKKIRIVVKRSKSPVVMPFRKTIKVGKTVKLKSDRDVKWSVSNKKTAKLIKANKRTVTVKGLKAGTAYVTAKAGRHKTKIKISIKGEKIYLSSSKEMIGIGEYCSVFAAKNSPKGDDAEVIFSSGDKSIASVDKNGLVLGKSPGVVAIKAQSKADKSMKAEIEIRVLPTKAGTITMNVDLSSRPEGKVAKVWLPVPQSDDHQYITAVSFDAPGAAAAAIGTDSGGGKQLYIEWGADTSPAARKATLKYHLYRRAVVNDGTLASKESGSVDTAAFADELKQTLWSGSLTSGIVKETADKIVADAGAATVYGKALAIYDWVCDNVTRIDDKKVIFGDVEAILSGRRKAGSCMDVNSVFVALCRAEGIPARNLFGMRFSPKYGPNCRAEFYLPGYGWVTADPALAIKQSWGHESEYIGPGASNASTWKGIKDKYWGNGEENWICINTGRDIWLSPRQSVVPGPGNYDEVLNPDGSINLYMFPYGEFDGQKMNCQDAANFRYDYSFEEEDPLECGC